MIPIFSNSLGEEELEVVRKIFASKWVGKGAECSAFEKEFGGHINSNQVLLLNNCTAAIYIALKALGIGKGDEVIVSTVNFVAVASAVIDVGAKPVFADVDLRFFNILPQEIERLKTPRTKAVFLLHYGGHPAPFDEIQAACGDDVMILEDSANAINSRYKGRNCGTLGDAGTFSFDAMKILVMVDGGALVLRDERAYQQAQSLRYLGLAATKGKSGIDSMKIGNKRWWEYDLDCTSGRFISDDVLAAIGRVQLRKLPQFIARRQEIWNYYQQEFAEVDGLEIPPEPLAGTTSSYYLYWIRVADRRDELANYLVNNNVYCTFRYFPLHLVSFYKDGSRLPNAEYINETALNLPLHQNLSDRDVEYIVDAVRKFFSGRRLVNAR